MADLRFLEEDSTVNTIDKYIAIKEFNKSPRPYLGMSEIGDECLRRLWLKYHTGFREPFSGRLYRLFETGHMIEKRVVRDLKTAGFKVSGRQRRFKDFNGMFRGHCDGVVEGLRESSAPHILEVKSANDKWFKEFIKEGICSNQKYNYQTHLYMFYAKLDRALFVLENKNDSSRHQERIKIDMDIVNTARERAQFIINAKSPPAGISERPEWFACKLCALNNDQMCRRDWNIKDKSVPF